MPHPPGPGPDRARSSRALPPHVRGQLEARPGGIVHLGPGQCYFGREAHTVRTLLGSCVSVVLWHPRLKWGGMCHYVLPQRSRQGGALDARYGDDALAALADWVRAARTPPAEYQVHLYGGADTLPDGCHLPFNVGARNIEAGMELLHQHGFGLHAVDVGERMARTVSLHLASGRVDMRRGQGPAPLPPLAPDLGARAAHAAGRSARPEGPGRPKGSHGAPWHGAPRLLRR